MQNYIQLRNIGLGIIFSLCITSCMSTSVVSTYDNDSIMKHTKTSWNYAWGLITPKDINPECESGQMNAVTSITNIGYILISAATLGIVVPQTVSWECAPVESSIEPL